jgi:hypothetical protein
MEGSGSVKIIMDPDPDGLKPTDPEPEHSLVLYFRALADKEIEWPNTCWLE